MIVQAPFKSLTAIFIINTQSILRLIVILYDIMKTYNFVQSTPTTINQQIDIFLYYHHDDLAF